MTELYKKYRPSSLQRVLGNGGTVKTLTKMLEQGKVPHTILFHGPSGCGKTTLARILKTELGCDDMDFKEFNSSSFRGIDSIRDISRTMNLATAGKCRIFLLDEVHKLTNDAQNAALKMLEDTPQHVYFFLCTTEPAKLLKAIQTRCCEMPVTLLNDGEVFQLLTRVINKEKLNVNEDTIHEIIRVSGGSARMALVLLDKIGNLSPEEQKVAVAEKLTEETKSLDLCQALIKKAKWGDVVAILKTITDEPESTRRAVLGYARSVLLSTQHGETRERAYDVMCNFKDNFYDSGNAGLAAACFETIFATNE